MCYMVVYMNVIIKNNLFYNHWLLFITDVYPRNNIL
jgi:hypothetical protein